MDVGDIERTLPLSDEADLTAGELAALGQRIAEATGVVIPLDVGTCDASLDDLARIVAVRPTPIPQPIPYGGHWVIDIEIRDAGAYRTEAHARLTAGLDHLDGVGAARKHPADVHLPAIGGQLAASRAVRDIADQLVGLAAREVAASTGEPVTIDR